MAWITLAIAGLFEVCWALGLKYSQGFTNLRWSLFTVVTLATSMVLLAQSLRTLPIGTAYAVWTGIGAVGTAIVGMILFDEPRTALRLVCIGLIVAGIVGLKIASSE